VLAREAEPASEHAEPSRVFGRVQSGFARPTRQAVPLARVRAQSGQRVVVEGRAHACADADEPPIVGGPLPPENRRRMRSRMAGKRVVVITCLLTKTSAPLSETMSR
jgi:hypothetical protein